jgi:hypothetical protein
MISREQPDELSGAEVAMGENVSCRMDLASDASLLPAYNFDAVYEQIIKMHSSSEKVFPFVDIKSAEQTGSLAKLKSLPAMSAIVDVFRKAGLEASIGYNMSSCDISLTLNVKVLLLLKTLQIPLL